MIRGSSRFKIFALLAACTAVSISILGASSASASFSEYGIKTFEAHESSSQLGVNPEQAGMHPDFTTKIVFNSESREGPLFSSGATEDVSVALPPGLVGDVNNIPRCTAGQFQARANCPIASQVGLVGVLLSELEEEDVITEPLYNLEAPNRDVARLAFWAFLFPVYIDVSVRTGSDYGVTATVHQSSGLTPVISAETIIWGDPADPIHDPNRLTQTEAEPCFGEGKGGTACFAPNEERSSGLLPLPFLSNPTACEEQEVRATATTYQLPGQIFRKAASMPATTGCGAISFQPDLRVEPTSRQAGAPTGLSAVLKMPQTNDVNLPATSPLKDARVTLPEGMTIAAGAAEGLEACSDEQVGYHPASTPEEEEESPPGEAHCPAASKIGTATFVSPDLPQALHGGVYQRTPGGRGHLFRIWLVTDELGLHLKIPGEIEANPNTGQLTTVFTGTPQLPVEEIDLEIKGGARAPLKNPASCGSYSSRFELTPWSGNAPVLGRTGMTINEGCNTGGFKPSLSAGTTNPVGGAFSPFILNVTQGSGEQNLTRLDVTLPPGLLAKPAGVDLCSDAQAAMGACPAGSQVGTTTVATGPGPSPLWIPQPGKSPTAVYLSGPYKGGPYSLVIKTPAQAGPFDLGTVVVRAAIQVNPTTAQLTALSDPLPQILEGVPVSYRTVQVEMNRPEFTLNPTSCDPMTIAASATSALGTVANLSSRFQVGSCERLGFKPSLALSLKGGTGRNAHPALRSEVTYPKGKSYANIGRAEVTLPSSEFIDQARINNPCTRVQFNANQCPASSVLGTARATTPLFDQPLEGPVYFRSNGGERPLPDIVADLKGQFGIEVVLVGQIDSKVHGEVSRIRTTFATVPDAPVTKFVLNLKGGKHGLLVNSANLCAQTQKADVALTGQNGRQHNFQSVVKTSCSGKGRAGSRQP